MIFIISMWIPDVWKRPAWLLWDRRKTWTVCKGYYRDFQSSYEALRFFESTVALLKECRAQRGKK